LSEASGKATHTWFDNTLLNRLNDKTKGCIVIVMQRLHQDDLVGHVLEQEDWDVLCLPAIAEVDECHLIDGPLGQRFFRRKAGDILHPARESAVSLANTRRAITAFSFAAQYQQNPMPLGGAIVKTDWLRYYEPGEQPSDFWQILQSWDTANKYVAELTGFPGSRYADQVDSTTQARDYMRQNDDLSVWARLAAKTRQERLGG
jgi:hypothetical protein